MVGGTIDTTVVAWRAAAVLDTEACLGIPCPVAMEKRRDSGGTEVGFRECLRENDAVAGKIDPVAGWLAGWLEGHFPYAFPVVSSCIPYAFPMLHLSLEFIITTLITLPFVCYAPAGARAGLAGAWIRAPNRIP